MSSVATMPKVRGRLTPNAPLAPLVWFKSGGNAEWLFEPADVDDLTEFLGEIDPQLPVMALGLGSNLIVRDGGVRGIVVRLGKAFAKIDGLDETRLRCGGGASGILVSSTARDAGIAGLEFLRGIPGTVGGFVRMNGGAYGRSNSLATLIVTATCRMARSLSKRPSTAQLAIRMRSAPRWMRSPAPAKIRSRSEAAPAVRPSRTRPGTRRGR
jgi:UDP-N-acetylenolpyruvoylglucosamine reductase